MTQSTRQEIIDAHDALETLYDLVEALSVTDSETHLARKHCTSVLAALPPRPQPTMAEVEWDDDKHYLAEAANPIWGTVVMLNYDADRGKIQYICYEKPGRTGFESPENLTPTGYQCTLTEVQDD